MSKQRQNLNLQNPQKSLSGLSSVQDRVRENMRKDMNVTKTNETIQMNDQPDGTERGGC